MATTLSPSSSSPHDDGDRHIPTALALPAAASAAATRRLPPPCWTPDETTALIDAYKDKWYSLRRSNLRANHWQEVSDDVASRCPASPRKTAVQCRHKMEKLRKRYRAEIQRAAAGRRFTSSWAHFQNIHSMEKGHNNNPSPPFSSSSNEDDDRKNSIKRINNLYQKGVYGYQQPVDYGATAGVRIKIPGGMAPTAKANANAKAYNMFDEMPGQNFNQQNPRFPNSFASGYGASSNRVSRDGLLGRSGIAKRAGEISKKKKGDGGVSEVAAAIQTMGEGFMRIEKVKMDMARQIEEIRMEMELKRTEMILESQQRIVEAFAKGISETSVNNKAKRMQTTMPDC